MQNLDEHTITESVLATFQHTQNPRLKTILESLVRHLHGFAREVRLTEDEWSAGIDFLTRTGHMSMGGRQEFILLSDVLGLTMLMESINHHAQGEATENSVLGPFFVQGRPAVPNGGDISGGLPGTPLYFAAEVRDVHGTPIAGASVDIWQSDDDGFYDVQREGLQEAVLRGQFTTDAQGRFWMWSIVPAAYPIPYDGPVGQLLTASERPYMRPAHVHVLVQAPGFERLTTMLFLEGDPHLDNDPVFGVKDSLVKVLEQAPAGTAPDGTPRETPYSVLTHTFKLTPTGGAS
ncbi:dioxygenase (plasmid) [Deinococcus radiomollis]|uniref:dioxygenase family protein n=1 Tax=Deinococcus radiomollis TaxID=468916 RepID=UPI00389221D1